MDDVKTTKAAQMLGITFYKLLYLERVGKIPPARRDLSGQRVFNIREIKVIKQVLDRS